MAELKINVKMERNKMAIDERMNVIADVTVNGFDVSGATVSFASVQGGDFAPVSALSDQGGNVISTFTPDTTVAATVTYEIVVTATKAGLDGSSTTVSLVVEQEEVEYLTKDKEYHVLTYGIRQRLLDAMEEVLDQDPDLYISTGATDKPRFMNGFSYTTREFPQIVISSGAPTSRRVGIGRSVGSTSSGTSPSIVNHINVGGWFDMVMNLTVIAEDKATQEKLLDKCLMVLYGKQNWLLYAKDGILVLDVSGGPETTQPYGSRLLYSGSVRLMCATEWFLKDRANTSIGSFETSVSI